MSAPEKRRRLNEALAQAIGASSAQKAENIAKPIGLALKSDEQSALQLLRNVNASQRPKDVLDATLENCQRMDDEATVSEPFLALFRTYFPILGIDSAISTFNQIKDSLRSSLDRTDSTNEVAICCEFLKRANLLGHGFTKLVDQIRASLPELIKKLWEDEREDEAAQLCYNLICLLLAEHCYRDDGIGEEPSGVFDSQIYCEDMKESIIMALIGVLAHSQTEDKSNIEWAHETLTNIDMPELIEPIFDMIFEVFTNHLEHYAYALSPNAFFNVFQQLLYYSLENKKVEVIIRRLSSAEMALFTARPEFFKGIGDILLDVILNSGLPTGMDELVPAISEIVSGEATKKEILKLLKENIIAGDRISHENGDEMETEDASRIVDVLRFVHSLFDCFADPLAIGAVAILLNFLYTKLSHFAEIFENLLEKCLKCANNDSFGVVYEVLQKIAKKELTDDESNPPKSRLPSKRIYKIMKSIKRRGESLQDPTVNRSAQEVNDVLSGFEDSESDGEKCEKVIELIRNVHRIETKKDIFESLAKFLENLSGGSTLKELDVFKILIETYGNTHLEPLCAQLVISRVAADRWSELDRLSTNEEVEEPSEEIWYQIIVKMIELLDAMIKSAKNSIIRQFTAVFCQFYTNVLKNTQKFLRNSMNASQSKTFTDHEEYIRVLKRHKLQQDVARIVDSMKRHESYFAMLTASIIADGVFNGQLTLLAMAKLHSLAEKNASALLATNLPVVERTRYKKFLPIITRAGKRIY
ncbi:unnamed protein product [Caenorhabditis bovis]|uniref:Uncharacterized protein n=1 Tax=Caenorhabditis bovis TaxID=2654633 RepID=A0A8S1EU92_9PELO|nr:unnamed protein product [Caenorhabditis bovis]